MVRFDPNWVALRGLSAFVALCVVAACSESAEAPEGGGGGAGGVAAIGAGNGGAGAAGASGGTGAVSGAGQGGSAGESATLDAAVTRDAGSDHGDSAVSEPLPACSAALSLAPGETNESLEVGGVQRSYVLHVPDSYDGEARVPLVIDFHPLFGTGMQQRNNSGYAALSDSEGFVVAYPDGIDNAWNVGPCCTQSRSVDDLGFAKALVARLLAEGCIDPKRVYAAGFSMGGGMSHFLACNAADVFAAVAPSAFDLLTEDEEPCQPSRPISVISFRGTSDFIVPYAGGASNPPNGLPITIHFRGAVNTFEHWADLNGCTGSAVDGGGGCQTYDTCNAGVEVTLCTSSGGHTTGSATRGWAALQRFTLP